MYLIWICIERRNCLMLFTLRYIIILYNVMMIVNYILMKLHYFMMILHVIMIVKYFTIIVHDVSSCQLSSFTDQQMNNSVDIIIYAAFSIQNGQSPNINKKPTNLNCHLSIIDFTLVSCRKYLHINIYVHILEKRSTIACAVVLRRPELVAV